MNERVGRVRMRDRTKDSGAFGHQPPVVVWRCTKGHRVLRVFLDRAGWHLLGERLRVSLDDWLKRQGGEHTVEDLRAGRVGAMGQNRVDGVAQELPLDIDTWPTGVRFEVGCRCGSVWVELGWLAEDCRHAAQTRQPVTRRITL